MKRKIGLLVILLLILCGMLLAGTNKGYHKDVYSEHYVPVEEVQDELSFSIYKEMDWEQILLQKQEYLTKKAASDITIAVDNKILPSFFILIRKSSFRAMNPNTLCIPSACSPFHHIVTVFLY